MLVLVSAARDDFPSEKSASKSWIDALANAVRARSSNASPAQIAVIVAEVASARSSVKSFSDATSSKCS